jgi:fructose/tagatose bisphosphate aldolase
VSAAIVDSTNVIWAEPLLPPTLPGKSSQKVELIALNKALELEAGKKINIYTDSRYAFTTAHVQRAIYQKRRLTDVLFHIIEKRN